ncbi:hypothetical protein F383_32857 [Gossypium arboreum]|uniref:Uncharacterized protein n=1 Tax=Gossypium arboreum TaxID=29729 RepID=A0A0B0MZ76_GOSAR|nr:hypothetical protein F383_32857 [Gossypium arboreum]
MNSIVASKVMPYTSHVPNISTMSSIIFKP